MSRKSQNITVIVLGVIAVLVIVWVCFYKGYFNYAAGYIKCGKTPVAVFHHFAEQKATYFLPTDADYPGPNVFMKYVCSEQEAIDEGADWSAE